MSESGASGSGRWPLVGTGLGRDALPVGLRDDDKRVDARLGRDVAVCSTTKGRAGQSSKIPRRDRRAAAGTPNGDGCQRFAGARVRARLAVDAACLEVERE